MRTDDALLILLDWRLAEESATITELHAELSAAGLTVNPSTVHRSIQRLRDIGQVTCLGHEHSDGRYLSRMYALTRTGRLAARGRRGIIEKLLETPPSDLLEAS
jgi:DNA-binding PadR family transcriptional regulator